MQQWQKLVSLLLEALGDEVALQGRPAWVFVAEDQDSEDPEAFALGVSWDPEAVLGSDARGEWMAAGLVATGKTFTPLPTERSGYRLTGRQTGSVRLACLVTREAGVFAKAVTSDGQSIEEPPEGGRLIDDLRRCMGLPPSPPATYEDSPVDRPAPRLS